MFQNIILLVLVILLLFFISSDKKMNALYSKTNIKYLFLLIIIYFIYQNYNLILLIIALLIIIYFNVDFTERFKNNKYLEKFKDLSIFQDIKEKFSNFNFEDEDNERDIKIEPFKQKVTEIKDLFENIKNEMQKIV